jgi:phytol kinase
MNSWLAQAAVLAALSGLLAGASMLRRHSVVSAEVARKIVHVGMGLVCLPFPWLFADARPVVLLAAIAVIALGAVRSVPVFRAHVGCALHDVARRTYGEIAYVAGIVGAFVIAAGNMVVYVVPVLVLTLADPAAALIGERCTRHRFATREGSKSIAGSLTFFGIAALSTTIAFVVAGQARDIGAGVIASALLMLIEASAGAGLDNFAIPVVGGVLMRLLDRSSLMPNDLGVLLGALR